MNKKLLVIGIIGLLLIGGVFLVSYNDAEEVEDNMKEEFQGPVPEGYDLEHFRKTGETIKEVSN